MLRRLKKWRKEPAHHAGQKFALELGGKLVNGYEMRSPSYQNAVDLIPGWSSRFPPEYGLEAGELLLVEDFRPRWGIDCYGNISGKRVLEIGPLEASHTAMLDAEGAEIDAVESSGPAFLKCLITKEILNLKNARFHLGDANAWLADQDIRYDFIVASGVLYHMTDPVRLLRLIAGRTDDFYLWTLFVDDDTVEPTRVERFEDIDIRLYSVPYGAKSKSFCGGSQPEAMWMNKSDLISLLHVLGFRTVMVAHEGETPHGIAASFFVSRRPMMASAEDA